MDDILRDTANLVEIQGMRSIVDGYPAVIHAWLRCCVLLLAAQPVLAQSRGIDGVVRDPQQAVVAGAQVILTNTRTAAKVTIATDGQGRYNFTALMPDRYVVEVHVPGFQVATSPEITLGAGDAVTQISPGVAGATESVTVTGRGGSDQRYRVETVTSLGPSGPLPILDTPYTVNILPGELMVNAQAKSFKEASKYLPLVEFQEMQGSEILRPATRGMQGSNMQNARMDGMGIVVTGANSMESLQQIERSTDLVRHLRPRQSIGDVQLRSQAADRRPGK
jgi:iron complex outermembrane receptor protein